LLVFPFFPTSSGSLYERGLKPGYYQHLLDSHKGHESLALEEIEKDLRRSLPEHPAFQAEEGIERLRRVLYAYSFKSPEVGYCQAMNLFTSVLLLFMGEEETFFTLCSVCDRMLPGYYTTNMVGAVVDQHVFERLIEKFMPILAKHIKDYKLQLSIACLPWFLTQFTLPMPLEYSCRVLDCFFMDGVRALFMIAVAIMKRNGEALLAARDDGEMLSIFKEYFANIAESKRNPIPPTDPTANEAGGYTEFDHLLATAYNEFNQITEELIVELRGPSKLKVAHHIGEFSRKMQIRA